MGWKSFWQEDYDGYKTKRYGRSKSKNADLDAKDKKIAELQASISAVRIAKKSALNGEAEDLSSKPDQFFRPVKRPNARGDTGKPSDWFCTECCFPSNRAGRPFCFRCAAPLQASLLAAVSPGAALG